MHQNNSLSLVFNWKVLLMLEFISFFIGDYSAPLVLLHIMVDDQSYKSMNNL
jgi:hypothetical protein